MQELHLVGFTTDLEQLIFSVRKGAKSGGYTVSLDEQLLTVIAEAVRMRRAVGADVSDAAAAVEAAVREGSAASAAKAESALTPREIQARLRAGRTVKQVAKAAGVTEAWIERFAAPVRGEQAQMSQRARSLVFSKPRLGESAEPLGLSVRWNVAEKGVRFTEQEFDEHWAAYQFQDHVWVIRFAFESRKREHVAEWILDLETNELIHRNRLASDLGYLEPGKRRKISDLVPEPAELKDEPAGNGGEEDEKPSVKRTSVGRGSAKKSAAKTSTARKPAARKSTAKKSAGRKSPAKKSTAKKAAAKKSAAKKSTAKKSAAKRSTAKKSAAKKSAGRKARAKKSAARKSAKAAPAATGATTRAPAKNTASPKPAESRRATKSAGRKTTQKGGRRAAPAAKRSEAPARPPAAERPARPASPWPELTAGAVAPARTAAPVPTAPPDRPSTPRTPARAADRGADRRGRDGGPRRGDPGHQSTTPTAAGPEDIRGAAEPASSLAPPPTAGDPRAARRAARRARVQEVAGDDAAALPPAAPGQVVTIRANRATPPLAERADPDRRPATAEVDEGVVAPARQLRPAMQARPPRRRRYGNRG